MAAREVAPILPSPWMIPGVVELSADGRALAWSPRSVHETSVANGRELADLLDSFSQIGRSLNTPRWTARALVSFADRWGPWSACEDRHDHEHQALSVVMKPRPNLALPPRLRLPRRWRQPTEVTIVSARRVNALRTLVAQLRVGEPPDRLALATLLSFDYDQRHHDQSAKADQLVLAGAGAVQEEIDGLMKKWITEAHVGPAASGWQGKATPFQMKVGGASGAIAVATLAERSSRLRTAICDRCKTPRSVWKGWDETMVTVGERCRTCKGTDYGVTFRTKDRSKEKPHDD